MPTATNSTLTDPACGMSMDSATALSFERRDTTGTSAVNDVGQHSASPCSVRLGRC